MRKIQVFTDSTGAVNKAVREQYGIEYCKMMFTIDNKDYPADLDWSDITPEEYYGKMRKGSRSITTLVMTPEFEDKFTKALEEGKDILYISCSSKLSGSVNNGKIAAQELQAKYPDAKIVCYDSLRSNYGEGLMTIDAAMMVQAGMTMEQIVAKLDETKLNYQTYATVGSLEWLKKAGRVKASAAFFGNLFGVKPIIVSDAEGNNAAFIKVKGRKTSLDYLVSTVCDRLTDAANSTVYVEHADSLADAEYVAAQIKEKVNPKEVYIQAVGPIVGATVGPDSIVVSFYGKKVEIVSGE